MANFSGLQSKFMRMYESNPQYRMLSVDSAMAQMVQDGVLTKAEYDQLIKTSAFGFGFNADLGDSVNFGGTTPVENYQHSPSGGIVTSKDKPKLGQLNNVYIETATLPANYQIIPGEYTILTGESYTAFSYLQDIFEEGKTSFEQQRMNEGLVSDAINAWREWINAKATRSDVSEKLTDTQNDVELLNAAMRGALVDGNGNNVDFETAFEATRGVKYSKEKIELCQQKAETYAQADMFHTGLEDLISNLEKFSHGSSDLQYAKEFNKNALKTLSILGLSEQGKINEALAETSKAVGYEIKLVKQGTKGKDYYGQDFAIMFKNKDGKFVPLTPEISRMISDDLISKIDATKKALLGLPLDSSDKEVEKHLERLKNEYEQSFREAYGDKDISILSEEYITAQQKGMMAVNLGTNIVLIATSMLTGGVTAGLMTGLLMTQPLQALEMFTDENADTNLEAYGKMMLSQIPWMGAGMVMGKLGDLARSFVKLKGLQTIATKTGQSLDDLVKFMSKGGELKDDVIEVLKRTRIKADVLGISTEMLLDYAVTKLVQPEGATRQDWIMSFVGALAGSSLNKNISDFTKTKDVRAVELQKAFPDLRLSAEEAGRIISKIDEMVADGSWEQTVAKGADETTGTKDTDENAEVKTGDEIAEEKVVDEGVEAKVVYEATGTKVADERAAIQEESTTSDTAEAHSIKVDTALEPNTFSKLAYELKVKNARNKLANLKGRYNKPLLDANDIDRLIDAYLENPKAVEDVLRVYEYSYFAGADGVDLAILNVKSNGAVMELKALKTTNNSTIVDLYSGADIQKIVELSLKTDGLAMEFARIPQTKNTKSSSCFGGYNAGAIEELCNLSEKYGKENVLRYAEITNIRSEKVIERTYLHSDIASFLEAGEKYGHDVIYEIANKTKEHGSLIPQLAKLNSKTNGLLLELLANDMEYKLHTDFGIGEWFLSDWETLINLASQSDEAKQSIIELMNYRNKKGKMKFDINCIKKLINDDLYPKYKEALTEFINKSNEELPEGTQQEYLYTLNPTDIIEAYANHKDKVIELSRIKIYEKTRGYVDTKQLAGKDIATMATCWASRPEDAEYILGKYLTSEDGIIYKNNNLNLEVRVVIKSITDWMKLNAETDGAVVKFNKKFNFIYNYSCRQIESCIQAFQKNETIGNELIDLGLDFQDINDTIVELYKNNKEDYIYLFKNEASSRDIVNYLGNNLYQNNKQAFVDIIGVKKDYIYLINENVINAYRKDPESFIKLLNEKLEPNMATELMGKDYFESNKAEIFEMLKVLYVEHSSLFSSGYYKLMLTQELIDLYKKDNTHFCELVTKLQSNLPSENIETLKTILASPLYQKYKTEFTALLDLYHPKKITEDFIKIYQENGFIISALCRGDNDTKYFESLCANSGVSPEDIKNKLKNQEKKMLEKPELYINGEYNNIYNMKEDIIYALKENSSGICQLAAIYDKEAFEVIMRMRLDNLDEYTNVITSLSKEDKLLLQKATQACNVDGKPLMPKQKIDLMFIIDAYKKCQIDRSIIADMLVPDADGVVKIDIAALNKNLLNKVMKICGMTDEQIASIDTETLMGWDMKRLHLLANEIHASTGSDKYYQSLFMQAANSGDFEGFIHNTDNKVGQANRDTRTAIESKGGNYDTWIHTPKELEISFKTKNAATDELANIVSTVTQYLANNDGNSIQSKIGKMFEKRFGQYIKDGKFTIPQDIATNQEKLITFIEQLLPAQEGQPPHILDDVWARAKANLSNPQRAENAQNTLTIQFHLAEELERLKGLKSDNGGNVKAAKALDLTVGMWDRNPQKDIFQGNLTTCCIGMNEVNGHAMFYYLLDTAFNFITVKNNTTGEVMGNALCYLVEDKNGKLSFVVDNIEINNNAKPSEETCLQIRQQIANYASRVAKSVTGKDDTPIFMSGNYNDVPDQDLTQKNNAIKLLGKCNREVIYLDLFGGWTSADRLSSCKMLRLIPEE